MYGSLQSEAASEVMSLACPPDVRVEVGILVSPGDEFAADWKLGGGVSDLLGRKPVNREERGPGVLRLAKDLP